ncbi:glycine zipper family protein [Streptococcus equinus]|uniref:glycine zipper family protein n=1 Tax=Streptococcus equinus TaxID=1335 RepID=UPI00067E1DC3|nr:glycine zipper family protein [Streptococcus equinus]
MKEFPEESKNILKQKIVGKAVKHGALDAVSSIGPLEGATLGAAVGGVPGAVIGAGVGAAIQGVKWIEPNFFDDPVKGTKDIVKKLERVLVRLLRQLHMYLKI